MPMVCAGPVSKKLVKYHRESNQHLFDFADSLTSSPLGGLLKGTR